MSRTPKFENPPKRKYAGGLGTGRRGVGNRPMHAADEADAVKRKLRRARALELRSQHASYSQISRELGISFHQARDDVKRAISECGYEQREEARALLNAQHDADLLRLLGAIRAILPLASLRGGPSRAPRLAWRPAGGRIEELPNGHPQGACQPQERVKRQVYPTGLDTLKLSHVDAEALGRNLLGPSPAHPDLPHTSAEVLASAAILRIHGPMFRARGARQTRARATGL